MVIGPAALGAAALGAVGLARWALPSSPFPPPTGPCVVGTTTTLVRAERDLPVQIWYPASAAEGAASFVFPSPRAPAVIAANYGVPAWLLAPLRRIRSHGLVHAPPRTTPSRGVVVMVHGWMGFRSIHADLAEQLASDGWVVLAADHVGGALVSQYPDGTAVGLAPDLMPTVGQRGYGRRTVALVDRYADDVSAILDALDEGLLPTAVPGAGEPEPGGVVLIAQSTGGGAAVRVAARDRRVGAVVGLDPWVEPVWPPERRALHQPMIAIRSGQWVGNANDAVLASMPGVERRSIPGAVHTDLTGLGYLTPLTRLTGLSRCDPALSHDAALRAFADVTGTPG